MDQGNLLFAFGLTLFAGLSTGIGSALAFFSNRTNKRFLSGALGFSAGVMIYLSFTEILTKSIAALMEVYQDEKMANMAAVAGFFGGMIFIAIIDRFVPEHGNPHEAHAVEDMGADAPHDPALMRMGMFTALAIAIHNFPEGLATFASAMNDPNLGISIALAVAIHNIPEGVSVSVPIYFATGSRKKAFWYSFLSGLSEPAGAAIGYFLLQTVFTPAMFGYIFSGVGGIMVFISLDELLPTAKEYGTGHVAIYGVMAGMAVMAVSLFLFM